MLRPLTENDIPQLLMIEIATQAAPWTEDILKKCLLLGNEAWGIEEDNRLIGFVIFSIQLGETHILNLGVHPDFQRRGFGLKLMDYALNESKKHRVSAVFLEVHHLNEPAIALYKKLGFEPVGLRKGYYFTDNGREDAFVFAKDMTTQ